MFKHLRTNNNLVKKYAKMKYMKFYVWNIIQLNILRN